MFQEQITMKYVRIRTPKFIGLGHMPLINSILEFF